jgi:predicted O-methyltransferase YrrM
VLPFADPQRRGDGQSGFRFLSRIHQTPDGEWSAEDQPEDWDLSRQMHALGKKVVCTRKVKLEHGSANCDNRSPWGTWPTDIGFLEWQRNHTRLLAMQTGEAPEGWRFPSDVAGWLSEEEGRALATLSQDKPVLEIGSYMGRSTICIGQTAASVVAVDPFDGRATTHPRDCLSVFYENLSRYGLLEKVAVHVGASALAVPPIAERFGFAFIDGDHRKEAVLNDAAMTLPKMLPGSLLAFHDYHRPGDEGVTAAVDELIGRGHELVSVHDTVAVLRV